MLTFKNFRIEHHVSYAMVYADCIENGLTSYLRIVEPLKDPRSLAEIIAAARTFFESLGPPLERSNPIWQAPDPNPYKKVLARADDPCDYQFD